MQTSQESNKMQQQVGIFLSHCQSLPCHDLPRSNEKVENSAALLASFLHETSCCAYQGGLDLASAHTREGHGHSDA